MTLDRDTINSILLLTITAAGAVASATWLGLILWTWRDMKQRSRDTLAQIAASLLVAVLGIFGIVIYVMLRPQETLAEAYERSLEEEALLQNIEDKAVCPGCGRPTKDGWQVCPYCHTKLKKPCARCGELLDLPWNLCPYCATPQAAGPQRAARRRPAAPAAAQTAAPAYETDEPATAVEYIEDDRFQ